MKKYGKTRGVRIKEKDRKKRETASWGNEEAEGAPKKQNMHRTTLLTDVTEDANKEYISTTFRTTLGRQFPGYSSQDKCSVRNECNEPGVKWQSRRGESCGFSPLYTLLCLVRDV